MSLTRKLFLQKLLYTGTNIFGAKDHPTLIDLGLIEGVLFNAESYRP
jgi:hypothetical protein